MDDWLKQKYNDYVLREKFSDELQLKLWQETISGSNYWRIENMSRLRAFSYILGLKLQQTYDNIDDRNNKDISNLENIRRGLKVEDIVIGVLKNYPHLSLTSGWREIKTKSFYYSPLNISGNIDAIFIHDKSKQIIIYEIKASVVNESVSAFRLDEFFNVQSDLIQRGILQVSFYKFFVASCYPKYKVFTAIIGCPYENSDFKIHFINDRDLLLHHNVIQQVHMANLILHKMLLINDDKVQNEFMDVVHNYDNEINRCRINGNTQLRNRFYRQRMIYKKSFPMSHENVYIDTFRNVAMYRPYGIALIIKKLITSHA